jgi:hypothetical protein
VRQDWKPLTGALPVNSDPPHYSNLEVILTTTAMMTMVRTMAAIILIIITTTTAVIAVVAEDDLDQEGVDHPHRIPSPLSQTNPPFLTEAPADREAAQVEARKDPRELTGLKAPKDQLVLEGCPVLRDPKD